ncbi:MAG: FGGY-family carbohydrate kinase, partial [Solirubrobacteraceae bacterium]|nr:FGGY-family carbohydrate kinase [Solirubrobacteraceae bacterium]
GGATTNGWLMQFQADVLGVPVIVPEISETTALGAAMMAGVGAALFTESDAATLWRERERYEPQMAVGERDRLLDEWHRAVGRSRDWAGA